jgi:hypothetical protein
MRVRIAMQKWAKGSEKARKTVAEAEKSSD